MLNMSGVSKHKNDVFAIFVHAGAGYHSVSNESTHLDTCNAAARAGHAVLAAGGTAVDACEVAVRILEDREITNAGYGSNLTLDGVVECDASIIDHQGRCGAVGAVAQIRNPISLARLILSRSGEPLSLRRVPPNLLVAQGATDYAYEHGMLVLPHDVLVSPSARERWVRWKTDLRAVERKMRKHSGSTASASSASWESADWAAESAAQARSRASHSQNMLDWVETQEMALDRESSPFAERESSPIPGSTRAPLSDSLSPERALGKDNSTESRIMPTEASSSAFVNSTQKVPTVSSMAPDRGATPASSLSSGFVKTGSAGFLRSSRWNDGLSGEGTSASDVPMQMPLQGPEGIDPEAQTTSRSRYGLSDNITDTVGAIAVDRWGHVACAASSGGIGMKHRGRIGPAALVGVGGAVVPASPDDCEETSVACVTSGTGEHMTTTMTSTVCAERLYHGVRREGFGKHFEPAEDDEVMQSVIASDFMCHPSVQNSNSAGAIGILAIKRTTAGIWFYYAHNTDSFAMSSMHSEDRSPVSVMSRGGGGSIAQGGRAIRPKKRR